MKQGICWPIRRIDGSQNRGLSLGNRMTEEKLHPIHPGEVLLEEFLKPMGLSQNRVALEIGVRQSG